MKTLIYNLRKLICSGFFVLIFSYVNAQTPNTSYTLSNPVPSNETKDFVATDFIEMINNHPLPDGFHTLPDVNNFVHASIDPYYFEPPGGGETGGPGEEGMDTDGIVGATTGNFSVSPNGAANYSIPIFVSPGTSGMAPELSFVYNSQTGDGYLGEGWSIAGISAITRSSANNYYDGKNAPLKLTTGLNLPLTIDGMRILKVADLGGGNFEYRKEFDDFTKIIAHTVSDPNGDYFDSFTAYTKSGLIYEYGHTTNSKQVVGSLPEHTKTPLKWSVNKISDRLGNYIKFNYYQLPGSGELRISSIDYTGNDQQSLTPYCKIKFEYDYNRGSEIIKQYLDEDRYMIFNNYLSSVSCFFDNELVRKYELSYINGGMLSEKLYLSKVKERVNEELCYNGTIFTWDLMDSEITSQKTNMELHREDEDFEEVITLGVGDFNSNSRSDFVALVHNSLLDKYYLDLYHDRIMSSDISFVKRYNLPDNVDNIIVGDYDGNGCSDVIVLADNNYSLYTFIAKEDANGNLYKLFNKPIFTDHEFEDLKHLVRTGDFNGDGQTDIMLVRVDDEMQSMYDQTNYYDLFYYNYDNVFASYLTTTDVWFFTRSNPIMSLTGHWDFIVGNYTGNRNSEFLINTKYESNPINHIVRFNVEKWHTGYYYFVKHTSELEVFEDDGPDNPIELFPGDFNGDRKSDLLVRNGDQAILYHSHGDDFTLIKDWFNLSLTDIMLTDYNGDGRTDIYGNLDLSGVKVSTYMLTNTDGTEFSFVSKSPVPIITETTKLYVSENNGNGRSDFIKLSGNANEKICELINILGTGKNLITEITNGLGSKVEISYAPYSQSYTTYIPSINQQRSLQEDFEYPIVSYVGPLMVVSEIKSPTFEGFEFRKTYKYATPWVHRNGKGFLGFAISSVTDHSDNMNLVEHKSVIALKSINNKYYYPYLQSSYTILNSTNEINRVWCGNEDIKIISNPANSLVFFPYASQILTVNTDPITNNTYKYETLVSEYDDYGNLTKKSTYIDNTWHSSLGSWKHKQMMVNEYKNFVDNTFDNIDWTLGRLVNSKVTHKVDGEPDEVNKSAFTYYPQSSYFYGMMETEVTNPDNDELKLIKKYNYDNWGNVVYTESVTKDESTRTLTSNYDERGRFSTGHINSLGHSESYTYIESLGVTEEHTDINGLVTKYEYDGFGNLMKTTLPDQTIHINVIRWKDGVIPGENGEVYYSWSKSSSSGVSVITYDCLGRKLETVADGFNGSDIIVNYYYNSKNQLREVTEPRFSGSSQAIGSTTYEYDAIGRLVKETKPGDASTGDRVTQYEYNGKDVITTNPLGNKHKLFHNSMGWVIVSEDAKNSEVTYKYKSNGLLRKIIAPDDLVIEMLYDGAGNRTKLIDPNLGTINYVYNGFGELKTKTDNKSQVTTYDYDALGRMVTRAENEGITTWSYDEAVNGLGKLHNVSGPGTTMVYAYDDLGRVSSVTENINGSSFTTNHTYDCYGRISSYEYPTGFAINNIYNEHGYLEAVENAATASKIWKAESMNARGQYEVISHGHGGSTFYDYFDETGLIRKIQSYGKDLIHPETQEMNFTWDAASNLLSREKDGGYNNFTTESFTYDELNRLKTAKNINHNYTVSVDYNSLGNIVYRSDVGTYQYEGEQPQALSGINGTNSISKLTQDISYTSFNKINEVIENLYQLKFTYGVNHERKLTALYKDGLLSSYKYFISGGMYEEEHVGDITKKIHYIPGGNGIAATYEITEDENGSKETFNYLLKDHIGSTVGIVNENGLRTERFSFDAWGKRRNQQTWMPYEDEPKFNIKRGFTGHEHLDEFALINMNGRVYDPGMGVFISPDPFIANPYYSQSLNRYAYVNNNPLSATDPSGYWSINNFTTNDMVGWLRTGAEIGMYVAGGMGGPVGVAFVGFGMNTFNALEAGAGYDNALGAGVQGAIIGLASYFMASGVGDVISNVNQGTGSKLLKAIKGVIGHGTTQGIISVAQGGRFESGFLAGAVGSVSGKLGKFGGKKGIQLTVAMALGGTASVLGGGKFSNGAVSAAFVVMFNDWRHDGNIPNDQSDEKEVPTKVDPTQTGAGDKLIELMERINKENLEGEIHDIIDYSNVDLEYYETTAKYSTSYGNNAAKITVINTYNLKSTYFYEVQTRGFQKIGSVGYGIFTIQGQYGYISIKIYNESAYNNAHYQIYNE